MQAEFYSDFVKRKNSTKRPTQGENKNIYLKQATSIENPSVMIEGINLNYNYMRIGDHYYFIDDKVVGNDNIFEISASQDELATYKDEILQATGYVEYSQSDFNKWIPDRRLEMSEDIQTTTESTFNIAVEDGSIIIAVAGTDPIDNAKIGFTNYYEISMVAAKELASKMYSADILTELDRMFKDPYKAIIEAHWVPFPAIGGVTNNIYVGSKNLEIGAKGLNAQMSQQAVNYPLDIPWQYNDWRDLPPYSTMELYLPFYGTVTLDQSKFVGQSQMTVRLLRDAISGEVNYTITCGDYIMQFKCDTAVPLAIGQTTSHKAAGIGSATTGIASVVGGSAAMATGHVVAGAGAFATGVGAIGAGAMTFFSEEASAKGGTGGFASANQVIRTGQEDRMRYIRLTMTSHKFGVNNPSNVNTVFGRPLFETRTLGTLSGYCQCAGTSIPISGLASDKEKVNAYVNSGFFIE